MKETLNQKLKIFNRNELTVNNIDYIMKAESSENDVLSNKNVCVTYTRKLKQ